jgi:polyisoprenoid-binding protein YceI
MQLDFQNKNTSNEVDGFNAQTKRMAVQVDAQEANATIDMKGVETFGKKLDNEVKINELLQPIDPVDMSDGDIMAELTA